jgi:hypothetical protein
MLALKSNGLVCGGLLKNFIFLSDGLQALAE